MKVMTEDRSSGPYLRISTRAITRAWPTQITSFPGTHRPVSPVLNINWLGKPGALATVKGPICTDLPTKHSPYRGTVKSRFFLPYSIAWRTIWLALLLLGWLLTLLNGCTCLFTANVLVPTTTLLSASTPLTAIAVTLDLLSFALPCFRFATFYPWRELLLWVDLTYL